MGKLMALLLVFCAGLTPVFAQTNTGRLVGTIASTDGVISGAKVTVTDDKTGKDREVTSAGDGTFIVPQLEVGTYTVKVTASGFKTFTATAVKIDIGREYSLPVALEVGRVEEAVTVTAGTDVLNATTGELSNTVSNKQIIELPLNGRNPLNLIALQPGVSSNGAQNTSINGLRTSFTNITRDGLNVQDGFIRSNATDFSPNRASVDNIGEFTITTSNSGADQNGGAQVRQVTPRGESKFHGSAFEFNRNSALAANNFFSNRSGIAIPFLNRNNFGGKVLGPMPLPRFGQGGSAWLKDKGFFFFGYEGLRTRQSTLAQRTILLPGARQGNFTYTDSANVQRTVNLFSLLPASAGITGVDPLVNQNILSLVPTVGNRTDIGDQLNTTGISFNQPSNSDRNVYTTRLDYDISERHSINGVFDYNKENNLRPDVDNPQGFNTRPATIQSSTNKLLVLSYRWTPTARLSNEIRGGSFRSVVPFDNTNPTPANYIVPTLISNPVVNFQDQGRFTRYYNFQDNADFTWGKHGLRFGGQLQYQEVDAYNDAGIVPTYTLGTNVNTPTLVATQFQGGIPVNQLNNANALLALLGGVVVGGVQSFNVENKASGFRQVTRLQDFRYGNHSLYIQDQWRALPSLTFNLGLRYELYTGLKQNNGLALEAVIPNGTDPVQAILNPNGTYNYIGSNSGVENQFYKTDKNNFAPIISVAWAPSKWGKFGKYIFGEGGKTVLRGGYRQSYLNDQMITALNNAAVGNVGLGTTAVNAINSGTGNTLLNARLNSLTPIPSPGVPVVPRTFVQNNGAQFNFFGTAFAIDPNIQTPKVQEYNFGIQREFGANAVEIRYVGTRGDNLWRSIDYNQIDIINNGFLADFNRARANFVLTGNPACTTAQNAGCQALTVFPNLVNGGNLANAANRNQLTNGTPADLALNYINQNATGTVKFLANPNTGVANLFTNGAKFRYNSLQAEFRRRFTKGLYFQTNYTFQKTLSNGIGTSQTLVEPFLDNARPELEYSRADFDSAHNFKLNAIYELPFGNGRKFFNNAHRAVDAIIGGWQFSPIVTVSSGAPISFVDPRGTFNRAGRSARQTALTSLTKQQLKDLIGVYKVEPGNARGIPAGIYYINPSVINTTGRAAEGFGTTAFSGQVFFNNAPGQTSGLERAFIDGPWFTNVDATLAKSFRIKENMRFQLRLEAFNVFNKTNFFFNAGEQLQNINATTFGRINRAFAPRIIQIGGRFDF
ncbi:MAG TPA: TonB-dependent receptor [Blastocatellia bacterium]|nr:TonB-dependent receptor [Blastocatellia bacterium]HMX26952.1 TonB-dependent receptor [Blastocatellia bacterium]HNG31094.1 TonB-dependent receptor [Blastocatellia bacterium]